MLTPRQLADARETYASMVISGTSLTEAEAMKIAEEFYASDEPARIAALRTHPEMSFEEFKAEFRRVGLLKGPTHHEPSSKETEPDPLQLHPELAATILHDPTEPASEDEWPSECR